MPFEATFDPELRQSYREKCGLLSFMTTIGAMLIDNKTVGEFYGFQMKRKELVDEWLESSKYPHDPSINYPEFDKIKLNGNTDFYCHSNGLLPEYQHKGFGTIMKSYMLGYLKGLGFKRVLGHAHEQGSIQLNDKFGARHVHCFKNWYGTGHRYWLYEIIL